MIKTNNTILSFEQLIDGVFDDADNDQLGKYCMQNPKLKDNTNIINRMIDHTLTDMHDKV